MKVVLSGCLVSMLDRASLPSVFCGVDLSPPNRILFEYENSMFQRIHTKLPDSENNSEGSFDWEDIRGWGSRWALFRENRSRAPKMDGGGNNGRRCCR